MNIPSINLGLNKNQLVMVAISFIAAVSLVVVTSLLTKEELPADIDSIDNQVALLQSQIKNLEATEEVPSLAQAWENAKEVADAFDLTIEPFDAGKAGYQVVDQPHWDAQFVGGNKNILAAATLMQNVMPVRYHSIKSDSGISTISFSLIGVN